MKLISLKLENFCGIEYVELIANGESIYLYGDNGTGKTTIANAYNYLLTGKAFDGAVSFTPKTIKGNEEVHGLNHIVSGTFVTENDVEVTLKKDYHEVWTRKRGSAKESFTGNTIDHFVDGVPVKAKDYDAKIAELFGNAETINTLSNPRHFGGIMSWENRRKVLIDVCGTVDDTEVIERIPALKEHLQGRTVDDTHKIAVSQRQRINEQLKTLPARIDEAHRALPMDTEFEAKDIPAIESAIDKNNAQIEQLKALLNTGDGSKVLYSQKIVEIKQSLIKLLSEYSRAESEHDHAEMAKRKSKIKDVQKLESEHEELVDQLHKQERVVKNLTGEVTQIADDRERYHEQIIIIRKERFDEDDICPTCKQTLPEEQVNEARFKWNESKAKRLETLLEKATTVAGKELYKQKRDELGVAQERLSEIQGKLMEIEPAIESAKAFVPEVKDFTTTDEHKQFELKTHELQSQLNELKENPPGVDESNIETRKQIEKLERDNADKSGLLATINMAKTQHKRIEELKQEEQTFAEEYEQQEHIIELCERFVQLKAEAITENVNKHFQSVRFKLFEEQVNGGIKETCDVLIPSPDGTLVPWNAANTAGRVNAGLEIISALSKHYKKTLPIVIDNAESVSRYTAGHTQLILLYVDGEHEELHAEPGVIKR